MKLLRTFSFGLAGGLILFMIAATLLEKLHGTAYAVRHVYGSSLFAAAWGMLAVCSLVYLWHRGVYRRVPAFLLHLSFVVILSGALVTRMGGLQGSVHLRQDADKAVRSFTVANGEVKPFPFSLYLKDFHLEYYPGTSAPMDYESRIVIEDGEETLEGKVSMNHIWRHRSYRFYQSRYDADGKGSTLSVAHDPWGIAITYTGYGLLLLSMLLFFFDKHSQFRKLWHHPLLKAAAVCIVLFVWPAVHVQADSVPRVLPRQTAAKFGDLWIYYNDRVCPLQTLARDFTVKLCGKPSYKGLTAEQVLTGWLFYYDAWKEEPCIRIKSKEMRQLLNIRGEMACLTDFSGIEGYKLKTAMQDGAEVKDKRGLEEANEKFSLVGMVASGSIWRLYPYVSATDSTAGKRVVWYSLADRLPSDMPQDLWLFVRNSMNYVAEQVTRGDFSRVDELLSKIRKYQVREAAGFLPSPARFRAEKWYNGLNNSRPWAMASITIGILAFIFHCRCLMKGRRVPAPVTVLLLSLLGALLAYLCLTIVLRGFVAGHMPMSNGHETMQLMAASVAVLTFCFRRKVPIVISFGFLLCGFALLVSMLGEANPRITQLMPVLSSPLLSFHVMVIMIAYSLLAFVMLNGVTAVVLHYSHRDCTLQVERLQVISRLLLYPAVFLLAIGIFIGAVWANVSWGRYWGWDPKETWALITLLVYALALHPVSLPWFRRPLFFHLFSVIAFFSVLITYFGVNFLLGGMHSYA